MIEPRSQGRPAEAADPGAMQRLMSTLARLFGVSSEEVALLRVEEEHLVFVTPERLRVAGVIPLNAGSTSIAARTAATGRPEVHNRMLSVRHTSVFESLTASDRRSPIHKLMSAPVSLNGRVVAVVQVCRKAAADAEVPDFTGADLDRLVEIAAGLADLL